MIVYIVRGHGGYEGVWTTPQAALKNMESARGNFVTVRPLDSAHETPEAAVARAEFNAMVEVSRNAWSEKQRKATP